MPNSHSLYRAGRSNIFARKHSLVDVVRSRDATSWASLPRAAQIYVTLVIAAGAVIVTTFFPPTITDPWLFGTLLLLSCVTSSWKVNLPLALTSGSTLSVSYAAGLMALLLLGADQAMLIAVAGAWTQCTFNTKRSYPAYRTIFSMAGEALTIQATGLAFGLLGGPSAILDITSLPKAAFGGIATYFIVNTGLVATAIALSTRRNVWTIWHDNFLWSVPSFVVAGAAGALAASVVANGNHWLALIAIAPIYLTYRTYQVFLGRIEDQRRHAEETQKLHSETVEALFQARRAEQALAAEKERLAVTLRCIGDGVITTDLNGKILLINEVAEALTGWKEDEASGQPLEAVFHNVMPDTRERCDNSLGLVSTHSSTRGFSRCTILIGREGSEHPIEEIAALLKDAEGRTIGMVVAFRDISDALKAQEERAKASKIASLGLLAGGIAHDFNNILMAVMGNVSMARATTRTAAVARALDEANEACVRARQLTWQLLTFSRGGVPVKTAVDLPALLHDAAGSALRGTNVKCTFDIAPDLWAISADREQLVRVFNNIVVNAQQAMPHGGNVHVRVENVLETNTRWDYALCIRPGRHVRVSITDTGIGIPEEHIGKIFDPYFTTKQQGSGLGLATSYSIIKHHGGGVSVKSSLGMGTMISVELPASAECEKPVAAVPQLRSRTGRILVMDDEPAIRNLAVRMLTRLGHEVETVDDGSAALERYAQALETDKPFDAVLLDLVVPGGMGGRETIGRLSEVDPKVKAIVVSGYAQDATLTEFRDYGFKASIAKPYTLEELDTTLTSVITLGNYSIH
jgi:PAS domain S-box-containing protein